MSYYFNRIVKGDFERVVRRVTDALQDQGFGVLTEIDVKKTLKKKLDADFRSYVILGACNPSLAFEALKTEAHIGIMLPCNVVVQETDDGQVDVSVVNPMEAMAAVRNPDLECVAEEVTERLKKILEAV